MAKNQISKILLLDIEGSDSDENGDSGVVIFQQIENDIIGRRKKVCLVRTYDLRRIDGQRRLPRKNARSDRLILKAISRRIGG